MFDIGFFELIIIGVIGLVVLGPERLPHAIRMTSAWLGKIRRASLAVKEGLENEVNAHEIKKRIQEQLDQTGLEDLKNEFQADLKQAQTAINSDIEAIKQDIDTDATPQESLPEPEKPEPTKEVLIEPQKNDKPL